MGGKSGGPAGTIDTTGRTNTTGTGNTSASTQVDIPAFLQSFLRGNAQTAGGALDQYGDLASGPLVAGFTPDQTAAFDQARGFGASDPYQSALNAMQSTAQGDFLFGGPGQQAFVDSAVRSVQPDVIARFGGRGGNGLAQASIGQAAVDASARLFDSERNRQLQAAGALPGLAMTPIDLLLQTGGLQQQQGQNEINAPLAAQQNLYSMALQGLPIPSLLGSTQTGTSQTTQRGNSVQQQPYFQNQNAGILGGALSGASLGGAFGPIGMGLGAVGGGLLGLL